MVLKLERGVVRLFMVVFAVDRSQSTSTVTTVPTVLPLYSGGKGKPSSTTCMHRPQSRYIVIPRT